MRIAYRLLVFVVALMFLGNSSSAAADLTVIAHSELLATEISVADLRSIFLGTRTTLKDGAKVEPVLERRGSLLSDFAHLYLGKSDAALETYYRSLVFAGKWSMPSSFTSDGEVIAYVAKTRGAIGFVRDASDAAGVKTLHVK
jgi:hypothetical protein